MAGDTVGRIMLSNLLHAATFMLLLAAAACGNGKPAPATTAPAAPAASTTPATAPARPAIGPDDCCCPFASAEAVAFNVSPKAACEAAGSTCVEDARCSE